MTACLFCGRPVLYQGAEFCSPTCQEKAWASMAPEVLATPCAWCGQPIDTFLGACGNFSCSGGPRACALCRGPLEVGQGEESGVCPRCAAKVPVERREPFAVDTETDNFRPGCMAPALACVSWATVEAHGLLHHSEARPLFEQLLFGDQLIVGAHIAYDMVVACAEWPDLIPAVFAAYSNDRVTDVLIREKLIDIAGGWLKNKYSLAEVVRNRLKIQLDKGSVRLGFGELRHVPLKQWPAESVRYAQTDGVVTLQVYQDQEKDKHWLLDQFRQTRASFWLQLMSVWGLRTDEAGVRTLTEKTQAKFDEMTRELVAAGLMREKRTKKKATKTIEVTYHKNTKVAMQRMEAAWAVRKGDAQPNRTSKGISLNADNCDRSGDPLLEKYAEHSSVQTFISNFLPLVQSGTHTPIHTEFDSLLNTGRTSSSPNTQNQPVSGGIRECFVPRPGWMYAIGDYSGMELHTWSQVCFALFQFSDMGEALNNGADPHTQMAATLLGIPYEVAVQEYELDPKGRVYLPRQTGKVGNFGLPGGLGVKRFVDYARNNYGVIVTLEQSREIKDAWLSSWREARMYLDWVGQQGESGSIMMEQLFVGRFRGGCSYTEAANTMFQGLASDCAKAAGFLITRACYADPTSVLYGSRPVNFVHDEWVVEVPDDYYAHDRAVELARLMKLGADQYLPNFPSRVEPLLARRWSKSAKPVFDPCMVCGAGAAKKCRPKGAHHEGRRLIPWDFDVAA